MLLNLIVMLLARSYCNVWVILQVLGAVRIIQVALGLQIIDPPLSGSGDSD